MNRIFGYGGRKNHEQLLQDSNKAMNEAQQSMQQRISGIDTQISQLNVQLQAIQRKISLS